jgi:hypothetical protein
LQGGGIYHDQSTVLIDEGWRGVPQAVHCSVAHIPQQGKVTYYSPKQEYEKGGLHTILSLDSF